MSAISIITKITEYLEKIKTETEESQLLRAALHHIFKLEAENIANSIKEPDFTREKILVALEEFNEKISEILEIEEPFNFIDATDNLNN